jgi:hypothetical protein
LSVYLLHDSLVADQTNYYNTDPLSPYYQKGSPMIGFVHRNVLLKAATNMFGDVIPSDSIDIGTTYSKSFAFSNFRCDNLNYMYVVALVAYQGESGKVVNSMRVRVGEKKNLVYASK